MRSARVLLCILLLTVVLPALAQSAARITSFAADRQSITPDEAESGIAYVNLTWSTTGLNPGQMVKLQVLVLGQWYDALPATMPPLSANGSLRWTVPHPQRGEKITVTWETQHASAVWLEVYDIDCFPRNVSRLPIIKQENLAASGSIELVIPADYAGGGWQIHLLAKGSGEIYDVMRADLTFADVPQPILFNLNTFTISAGEFKRGDSVTVTWDGQVTARISENGVQTWRPIGGYEHRVYIEVAGGVVMGAAGVENNQRFTGLPLKHTLQVTIPNFEASNDTVIFYIGLSGVPIAGQNTDVMFDLITARLIPEPDAVNTEYVSAAFQQFVGSFMVWESRAGEVRVYYGANGGPVEWYPLSVYNGLPDNPVTEAPPEGFFKPVNAFGRIRGNMPNVRNALGWAVTGKTGYTMTIEARTDTPSISITLPNERRVYQVGNNWNF